MNTDNLALASIDLGKNSFHFQGHDRHGHSLFRRQVQRANVFNLIAKLPPCIIAMEACGGSHFMARYVASCGHQPRLIAAQHVRPFVKSNKNDFADAEAIAEAAVRPSMRFVAVKSEAQQALGLLNSIRDAFIKDRTATASRIHGFMLEWGVSLAPGFKSIKTLPEVLERLVIPPLVRTLLEQLRAHFNYLDEQVLALTKEVERQVAADDLAARLMSIPCVGPITSSALAAAIGDGKQFGCGRDYAASIGLVPRQYSTGGKPRLLGISKRGDPNQRRLLIQCARVYLIGLDRQKGKLADWVRQLLTSHHSNAVVCALANKLARIAWAICHSHGVYEAGPSVANT